MNEKPLRPRFLPPAQSPVLEGQIPPGLHHVLAWAERHLIHIGLMRPRTGRCFHCGALREIHPG